MANNRSANRSHSHRRLHYSPRINSLKRGWQFSSLWSVVSFNSRLSASTPLITIFTPRVASSSVLQKSLHGGERGPAAFQSPWKLKCQKQECFVRSERSTSEVKRPNNKRKKTPTLFNVLWAQRELSEKICCFLCSVSESVLLRSFSHEASVSLTESGFCSAWFTA